jgi:hypothetical protein
MAGTKSVVADQHGNVTKGVAMAGELSDRKPEDPSRINVHEEWELTYWVKLLGTSEQDLRSAVKAVGPQSDAVRQHLGKRQSQY